MTEPLCDVVHQGSGNGFRESDLECFPGPWRQWCGKCLQELDPGVEPKDVTDTVLKRTVTGRNGGNVLHIPDTAIRQVTADD